ncbi:hypothetical protein F7725_016493 [Dissostichus mawsoni]|uniref:SRCR domain-containing protein n=1 Tax=Dissostichus mawsoni TaxID=36200 RepID=A0A7J5Z269_DISMA|nr:hypothetical protein F7725_016493 [Dissostichus mawsoni]
MMRMRSGMLLLLLMQTFLGWTGTAAANTPTPPPPNPPVRLVGSNSSCSGRVEVFHNGTWGTVCDDRWDLNDGHVVCRQLGCGRAVEVKHESYFGQGVGPIWLDDLGCSGNEASLMECAHSSGSISCIHLEDAGVICTGPILTTGPTPPPPNPPVRLVGSNNSCSGRVEMFHNGQWGTVCDDGWDLNDAQCSGNETSLKDCVHSGIGSHNCAHSEDAGVICAGSAATIKPTPPPPSPPVRLVGNNNSCSGRVEIFHNGTWGTVCDDGWNLNDAHVSTSEAGRLQQLLLRQSGDLSHGQWGTVCDDGWDLNDAHVVCRQLGCGRAVEAKKGRHFGPGTGPIWLDNLQCSGNETSLKDCVIREQDPTTVITAKMLVSFVQSSSEDESLSQLEKSCSYLPVVAHEEDEVRYDAALLMQTFLGWTGTAAANTPSPPPPSPPVRLVGSNNSCSGRVEMFHDGQWGTVCDDGWDLNDAHVVCRQLGCGRAVEAKQGSHFGPGTGPIWLDNLQCSGNETSLNDCDHLGLGSHNCAHSEDAGVICTERPPLLQTAHLVCSNYIQVGVRLISLQAAGLQPFSGHMAAPFCSGFRVEDSTVWYQVPRQTGQCGTVMRTNTTHAIYSNNLFFHPQSNGSLVLPQIIPFFCAYPLETNISLNAAIRPLLNGGGLIGSGNRATAYMTLFHNSNFSYRYPSGLVTLPMGSPLCPTDLRHVSVIENGQSLGARFSALLFPLHGGNPYVFLHCTLRLCDKRTQNCVPHCRRRTYRSVENQDQLHPVTIGPIVFE